MTTFFKVRLRSPHYWRLYNREKIIISLKRRPIIIGVKYAGKSLMRLKNSLDTLRTFHFKYENPFECFFTFQYR